MYTDRQRYCRLRYLRRVQRRLVSTDPLVTGWHADGYRTATTVYLDGPRRTRRRQLRGEIVFVCNARGQRPVNAMPGSSRETVTPLGKSVHYRTMPGGEKEEHYKVY